MGSITRFALLFSLLAACGDDSPPGGLDGGDRDGGAILDSRGPH